MLNSGKLSKGDASKVKSFLATAPQGDVANTLPQANDLLKSVKPKGGSLFGKIVHGVSSAVTGAPRGILQTGIDLANVVPTLIHETTSGKSQAEREADYAKQIPALYGMAKGIQRTGSEVIHPSQIAKNYSADPVGAALNDAANVASILGIGSAAARGASVAAEGTGAAAAAERFANVAEKGSQVAGHIAGAPFLPVTGPARLLPRIGDLAYEHVMANPGEAGRAANVAAKLSPRFGELTQTILGGQANEEALREQQGRLAIAQHKILASPAEQQAMVAVGEHIAPAIAAVREHLPADRFDAYVNHRFAGTLTPESAHLAADVVEGKNPEAAARIDAALKLGSEAPGGRQELTSRYVGAKAGRYWQLGNEANPRAISDAVKPYEAQLPKAEAAAAKARLRATLHAPGDVPAQEARTSANPTGRLESAAMRVKAAADRLHQANEFTAGAEAKVRDRATRDVRASLVDEVKAYRRTVQNDLRSQAAHMESDLADVGQPERVGKYLRQSEALFGEKRTAHPMADVANQMREQLGQHYAERNLFAKAGAGVPLDVWLEDWNRRHGVVPQIIGGEDLTAVAEHAAKHINTARSLRSQAAGIIGRGVESDRLAHELSGGDPEGHLYLKGTPAEAAAAIEAEQGLGHTAGEGAISQARQRAERAASGEDVGNLAPAERSIVRQINAKNATGVAGEKLGATREATIGRLTEAGRTAGRRQGFAEGAGAVRGRVYENLAKSAETRVARLRAGAESARVSAENALTSVPARLRPMIGENRAAAHELVGMVNELHKQGLHDSAKAVEDAIATLPRSLRDVQGADAEHFFHTQEGKAPKGGSAHGTSLPRTFTPGSEKLRTGSAAYDRTIEGQRRGAVEAQVATARQETAAKIAKMPFVAHLGEGPLAEARTLEDAKAAGYVPWNPSSPFDTQGRVTPLGEFDKQLGIPHGTVFLPKPIFESFRNYFEPHRGQILGLVTDVPNRLNFIGKLALSPAAVVGRVFGHALLGFANTDHRASLARNIIRTIKDYRRSGTEFEPRHFDAPQRLLHSGATTAELDRLRADVATPAEGLRGKVQGASQSLNRVITKPFKVTSFLDNAMRSAYYLTEKASGATEEGALRSALRATGEFDRMTPFERDYVRRIIPFWAWHRELTRIALHLTEDHPLRVAWTLHLGNVAGQPDNPLPSWAGQTIPYGNKLIGTRLLFPFGETADTVGGGLFGAGKMLGPTARLAAGIGTGENPSSGKAFSHGGTTADFNGNTPGRNVKPALRGLLRTMPQERLFEALTGKDKIARYDTGEPVLTGQTGSKTPLKTTNTVRTGLASFLGVPIYDKAEAEASAKRSAQSKQLKSAQSLISKLKSAGYDVPKAPRKPRAKGGAKKTSTKPPAWLSGS